MKTDINKQTKYLMAIFILIFICEIMLQFNNKIIQCFGICIVPIMFALGYLLLKESK